MPKNYKSFCLVAAHLVKNAHRYYKVDEPVKSEDMKCTLNVPDNTHEENQCIKINKQLHEIRTMKWQNRIREQQKVVNQMKKKIAIALQKKNKDMCSFHDIASISGVPLKTVHSWCSIPKERQHKAISCAKLWKEEFINFLMQDTITFSDPCKRHAGKRFLLHTWDEVYKRYLQQPECHKNGVLSCTTLRMYKPRNILLTGSTPLSQCLCDYCENLNLIRKSLVAAGLKGLPSTKYDCIDTTLCAISHGQFGTTCRCTIWEVKILDDIQD